MSTQSYPVLPLRDIVVFPHMIVPLFVGREKSVRALEDVMKDDKQILLVEGMAHPVMSDKIRYFKESAFKDRLLPKVEVPLLTLATDPPVAVASTRPAAPPAVAGVAPGSVAGRDDLEHAGVRNDFGRRQAKAGRHLPGRQHLGHIVAGFAGQVRHNFPKGHFSTRSPDSLIHISRS